MLYNPNNDKDPVPYERCYALNGTTTDGTGSYYVNDYLCRTQCWQVIQNYELNLFNDQFSNGGLIQGRRAGQIPFYQRNGCLVEVRQSSLTASAYAYFDLLRQQTQNTGGVADAPRLC